MHRFVMEVSRREAVSTTRLVATKSLVYALMLLSGFVIQPYLSFVLPSNRVHGGSRASPQSLDNLLLELVSSSNSRSNLAVQAGPTTFEAKNKKQDDGRSDEFVSKLVDYFRGPADAVNEEICSSNGAFQGSRKRCNIQLTAGSGKTYIAWKVMESVFLDDDNDDDAYGDHSEKSKRKPKIGVYVTPYLNLVDQALSNRDEHQIMTALSSTRHKRRTIDTMIVSSRTSRKQELCSTDEAQIVNFLSTIDNQDQKKVPWKILVCTYSSLHKIGRAMNSTNGLCDSSIDFAVFDEAHKMEGMTRDKNRTLNGFAYGLYDSNIEIRNRLFMTGTPHNYTQNARVVKALPTRPRPDGSRLLIPTGEPDDVGSFTTTIRSFNDEDLFGPCLAKKAHRESVQDNTTLPISLCFVDTDVFQDSGEESENINGLDSGSEKDYFLPLAIQSAFHKLNVKHAVSFHSTNQRAREFMEIAGNVFSVGKDDIALFNMDHTMPPLQRREILNQAEASSKSLITNCKLLSMGVDEASWDLVIIADPVRSTVDGRQMIGRVGRKGPGKERGYVLVPVPTRDTDDVFDQDSRSYQVFVNTFNHMVNLDQELYQEVLFVIDRSYELGRPLVQSEYPKRLLEAFIFPPSVPLDVRSILMDRAIVEYSTESVASRWYRMFDLLRRYREREGDCNAPQYHEEDGENLGMWLNRQRIQKRKKMLDLDLEKRLEEVGVVWNVSSQQWEDMFASLLRFKKREGHCNVPRMHKEDGENLGAWLNNQRSGKKKGRLDIDSANRLEELGVIWEPVAQQWEIKYELLVCYREREGHCDVPQQHHEGGEKLGVWLHAQRMDKKNGKLDSDLETRLSEIGVTWDPTNQQWEEMYALLLQYKIREGGCNVPRTHQEDGQNLGTWLSEQRHKRKNGTLDSRREDRLEIAGVVWDQLTQQWEEMFLLLYNYKQREGNCNVPSEYEEKGAKLGTWLRTQRQKKKNGTLDTTKADRLNAIGVVWEPSSQQWENMFALLLQYKNREKNCNVPKRHKEDGKNLGSWLQTQRTNKIKGKLGPDREKRLTGVGVLFRLG